MTHLQVEHEKGLYFGKRDSTFKMLIENILKKSKLHKKYIQIILKPENFKLIGYAFTSDTVNNIHNYQIYEQLGDLSANKFIVMYMYKRFPQLQNTNCVKIVARLRINYGAKKTFFEIARKLGFWDYITATIEVRKRRMKHLLEDVFEAFLGVIELILDQETNIPGIGFICVSKILESIFNDMPISLKYTDLYDAKTRLKELFDSNQDLGLLEYKDEKEEHRVLSTIYRIKKVTYYIDPKTGLENRKKVLKKENYERIGYGYGSIKSDAQQYAAKSAIYHLQKQGFEKKIDPIYNQILQKDIIDNKKEKLNFKKIWVNDINELHFSQYKSKYNNKYLCTPIFYYIKYGNLEMIEYCLQHKAELDKQDSVGNYPIDLLFIYHHEDINIIQKILQLCETYSKKISISLDIINLYIKNNIFLKDKVSQYIELLHESEEETEETQ